MTINLLFIFCWNLVKNSPSFEDKKTRSSAYHGFWLSCSRMWYAFVSQSELITTVEFDQKWVPVGPESILKSNLKYIFWRVKHFGPVVRQYYKVPQKACEWSLCELILLFIRFPFLNWSHAFPKNQTGKWGISKISSN